MTPAEQLAFWADRLRDMAASGLKYSQNIYDFTGHIRRIQDAYRIWRGEPKAHFDT
jgi:hypothetical protein